MFHKRWHWAILGLVILGCWLRVWGINQNSLWFDEVFSRNLASLSDLRLFMGNAPVGDLHPPLHFLLLNLWMRLAGDSAISLRMFSALAMMLALPGFYHLGRLLFGERAGAFALLIGVFSPYQIAYSQEARMYAFSVLFGAWTGVGLLLMLRREGRQARLGMILYIGAGLAGLYTHYFGVLLIGALNLWLLLDKSARKQWRRWLVADLMMGVVFIPQILIFFRQTQAVLGNYWIPKPSPAAPITTLTFMLFSTLLPPGLDTVGIIMTVLIVVLVFFDLFTRSPHRIRPNLTLCLIVVFVPIMSILVYSYARSPLYLDKSFGLLTPYLLALIGGGMAYARRPSPVPMLMVGLGALFILGIAAHEVLPDRTKPPFSYIATYIATTFPDEPIVFFHDSAALPINYYAPQLMQHAKVIDIGDKSWMYPQIALFPQTWHLFGIERQSREEIGAWLATYQGKLLAIVTYRTEEEELVTLTKLLQRCPNSNVNFPPWITLYAVECK